MEGAGKVKSQRQERAAGGDLPSGSGWGRVSECEDVDREGRRDQCGPQVELVRKKSKP